MKCFVIPFFIFLLSNCYHCQGSGLDGLDGDLVVGHVMEEHDLACVVVSIVHNPAPMQFAGVFGLKVRDVMLIVVQVSPLLKCDEL